MWPGPIVKTFIHSSFGSSRFDLALIGHEVSEMFENNVKLHTRINEHGPRAGADDPMGSMVFY